jgi:transcriptional regulator of acetoin/glycerol metabolism
MDRDVSLSERALKRLASQGWPGNVAQLAQLLERAVAYSTTGRIERHDVEQLMEDFEDGIASIRRKHGVHQRGQLMETLNRTGGNISRAAEELGRSRGAIYRLIENYGIMLPRSRPGVG